MMIVKIPLLMFDNIISLDSQADAKLIQFFTQCELHFAQHIRHFALKQRALWLYQ